ncbi:tetratricopeptide repeat protein [Phormidesmis priestleyi ULC007]|uniref:Tetratricopeptide repeat protein n=1 Tax=Phormidesmis priestleyi ULC007 TaxID=1920490 RepID=A0A2T1D8S8_9CYAN|nr:tetratricopeptide repeat protein [Phormidesmis priestleyi]PSB16846.1 tetratricopeptide repeat protein [Phormidesmis priestleyi ULC007]PZO47761.1 MAG: tetratricopeptide repeat protein [Phormidesmis priestleyi]
MTQESQPNTEGQVESANSESTKAAGTSPRSQVPSSSTTLNNQGNNSGQIAVGKFIIQFNITYGGKVLKILAWSKERLRNRPRTERERFLPAPLNLVGRRKEVEGVITELQSKKILEFYGEAKIDRETLLRHLANHSELTTSFSDGVVFRDAGKYRTVSDLLQAILFIFYRVKSHTYFTNAEIRTRLGGKKALVLLDDVRLSRESILFLRDHMRGSKFVLASPKRCLEKDGDKSIPLEGMPADEALELARQEWNTGKFSAEEDPLDSDQDRLAVEKLRILLKGNPGKIREAVRKARKDDKRLEEIAEEIANAPSSEFSDPSSVLKMLNSLPKPARRILKVLAVLGITGLTLLVAQVKSDATTSVPKGNSSMDLSATEVKYHLDSLLQNGLIQSDGSRYSLDEPLKAVFKNSETLGSEWDLVPWRDKATTYFNDWMQQNQMQPDVVLKESDAVFNLLESAVDGGRWEEVVQMGRGLEGALALNGQWGAWEEVLNWELEAAKNLKDRASEAWALHQKGSRALCLGDTDIAYTCLTQALALREELDDRNGAAVTRHNLGLLLGLKRPESHLIPPILIGTVGAIFLSLWKTPDYNYQGYSVPISKPNPLPPAACIITGGSSAQITQNGNSFRGEEISYQLNGKPAKATLLGTLNTRSGWFYMETQNPTPGSCFIRLDGEKMSDGLIVGGASADEVLLDGKRSKIKTDKTSGATGTFRMTLSAQGANIWTLKIPKAGNEVNLEQLPQWMLKSGQKNPPKNLPPGNNRNPNGNTNSNPSELVKPTPQVEPLKRITELPPISSIPNQEELRFALKIATDKKDWSSAIEIVDRMIKNASPTDVKQLQEYKAELQKRLSESSSSTSRK